MNARWLVALIVGALASPGFAQTPRKPDLARAQDIVAKTCVACHGTDGNSTQPVNPNLAGQHADYTLKQLVNFKPQDGKSPARPSAVMMAMASPLSHDDMKDLAAYFEGQKPKPRTARDPQLVKLGQSLYRAGVAARGIAACTACHGPNGAGMPAQFPRLAGQSAEYTAQQLKAFRSGERSNDPNRMMRAVAEKLTDREIAALAEYISGLR